MFSLPPIPDPVRDALDTSIRHFSKRVGLATIVVAIGVALEGVELSHDAFAWFKQIRRKRTESVILKEMADIFPTGGVWDEAKPKPEHPPWVKRVLRVGLILVVIGVVGEWRYSAKLEDAHKDLHQYDLEKIADAATSAKTAHDEADAVKGIADEARADAKDALSKAQAAQGELARAETDAAKAQTAASKALSSADKAESRLAEASNKLDALWAKYERLTTPRSVPVTAQVAAPLMVFSKTEYVFVGACEDQECLELVWNINELLKLAGWNRIKGPPLNIGIPQFTVHSNKDFGVNMSISSGIVISVEQPGGVEAVRAIPDDQEPEYIRAAIALSKVLASNVRPPDNPAVLTVFPGTSKLVRIDVGRKLP